MGMIKLDYFKTDDGCLSIWFIDSKNDLINSQRFGIHFELDSSESSWVFVDSIHARTEAGILPKELIDQLREQLKEEQA